MLDDAALPARGSQLGIAENFGCRFPMGGVAADRDRQASDRQGMLDVVGLAARLGVTERFVRRMVHERRIPFYKVGALLRFDVTDVEHWLAMHRVDPSHRLGPR